jgi:formate hydrogenlyase subunit 5
MSTASVRDLPTVKTWREEVVARVGSGARFAGLFGTADGPSTRLTAALADGGSLDLLDVTLGPRTRRYPSLTPDVPPAFWYERELRDLTGVIVPLYDDDPRPRPGSGEPVPALTLHEEPLPSHLAGAGIFPLPHGPVRSGVTESVEFLIETPGEDIPHLRVRPHHKHRGLAKRFEQLTVDQGVLLAERVEGVASVAHALAFAHAVEDLAGLTVATPAALTRVVHAELERIANHLDVAMRLADAAALAVATARFGWHKERVLRLRSELCGNRFGRGVVSVDGVGAPLALPAAEISARLDTLEGDISGDERTAMATASFLDRLRGTGPLEAEIAARHGALGPIGRASGVAEDVRVSRPYDGYRELGVKVAVGSAGDVQERLRVRWAEVHESFRLARAALADLADTPIAAVPSDGRAVPDGRGVGWAEAPHGEVLYVVEVSGGRLSHVAARSASFHNLPLFHTVFAGDIFTDFPFIEASFGVSIAGVAG